MTTLEEARLNQPIRLIRSTDFELWMNLVAEYLLELYEAGLSEIIPSERSIHFYAETFYKVLDADVDPMTGASKTRGVIVISDGIGYSCAVIPDFGIDTIFGKSAIGIGTYVRPRYRRNGIGTRLREHLYAELRSLGFDTLIGGVHLRNIAGAKSIELLGMSYYQTLGYIDLRKQPKIERTAEQRNFDMPETPDQ